MNLTYFMEKKNEEISEDAPHAKTMKEFVILINIFCAFQCFG